MKEKLKDDLGPEDFGISAQDAQKARNYAEFLLIAEGKINNEQKREIIKRWAKYVQSYKAAAKALETATGVSQFDSKQGAAADAVCCQYTQDLEVLLGDVDQWLSWFAFETDFGTKPGLTRFGNGWIEVKTLDDLFQVMGIDA